MENSDGKEKTVNLNLVLPPMTREHVDQFGSTYRHNGVAIVLSDAHKDFALAFAGAMLQSYLPLLFQQIAGHFIQNPPPASGGLIT